MFGAAPHRSHETSRHERIASALALLFVLSPVAVPTFILLGASAVKQATASVPAPNALAERRAEPVLAKARSTTRARSVLTPFLEAQVDPSGWSRRIPGAARIRGVNFTAPDASDSRRAVSHPG
jgi:hypothetical protein